MVDSVLRLLRCGRSLCDDELNLELNELLRKGSQELGSVVCVAVLDKQVLPLDPAELPQRRVSRFNHGRRRPLAKRQPTDAADRGRGLRLGGERHDDNTAGHNANERPSIHR